ncbi:hypothetical protein, partial [uncultured Rubinisphaera sp.]|uniref:hypothetical protein n=1 Tax=uncultured Rubinisphaera sp. TaxID=1678686 RepID=UPI0030D9668F
VIKSAADRQRSHVEQFLGTELNKHANKLISQIDEAEITLLSSELRREYDRKVKLFKKRRKNRQIDPNVAPTHFSASGTRSVGEGSGFLREYAGIVAILAVAFFCMAAASFWLPWGKLDTDKVVFDKLEAQEKVLVPVPDKEVLPPESDMTDQEKPIPEPKQFDNSALVSIDVTIQSIDLPNQKITVSRESKSTVLSLRQDTAILFDGKAASVNELSPNQNVTISFNPTEDVISKIEAKQSGSLAPTGQDPILSSNENIATVDVTILAHDIPNSTLLVSRNSKTHSFIISPEIIYLHNRKPSSWNFFQGQKPEFNATITFDAEKDLVLKIETES